MYVLTTNDDGLRQKEISQRLGRTSYPTHYLLGAKYSEAPEVPTRTQVHTTRC